MLINGFFNVVRNSLFMKFCILFFCYCGLLVRLRAQSIITFGQGNTPNVSVTASSQSSPAIQTLTGTGFLPNSAAASRFLSQATLGHNFAHIQDVANLGVEKWLDNQLALPNSFRIQTYLAQIHQMMVDSLKFKNPANTYTLSKRVCG